MSTTVLAHATVVPVGPGRTVLRDGAVAVEKDRIVAVGPAADVLASHPAADVVDCRGRAVFPGLVNPHAHLTATLHRGITEDLGFPSSVRFPVSVNSFLSDEEKGVMAVLGAIECIRTGNTALAEVATGIAGYASQIAATGLRLVLAECASDGVTAPDYRPGEPVGDFSERLRAEGLDRIDALFEGWHGREGGRITCMAASVTLVETSSPPLLRSVRERAERHDTPYTVHLGQSLLEVQSVMEMHGARPAQYLHAHDFLGPRLVAAHCRYLDAAEVALMGATRSGVSHQPAMAARRAVLPPIAALRDAGCTVGLGTDNNTQDMVEVMRAALFTERILREDPERPQPEDVLEEATAGSARVLHMDGLIGTLEAGKKADLFVVNTLRAHLVPTTRIVSGFVHNGQPSDIEAVMVDGAFIMRDGRVLTVDEEAVVREADRIGRRAWAQMLERYPTLPLPFALDR